MRIRKSCDQLLEVPNDLCDSYDARNEKQNSSVSKFLILFETIQQSSDKTIFRNTSGKHRQSK
jgi:hypothetical protein